MSAFRRAVLALAVVAAGTASAQTQDDPFQWLEDVQGEKALAWAKEHDAKSTSVLEARAEYKPIYERTLQILDSWERPGPYAGQWHWLHSLAVDSKGNLYTAESRGNRLQKFVRK